jgi:hypothetical protein
VLRGIGPEGKRTPDPCIRGERWAHDPWDSARRTIRTPDRLDGPTD